MLDPATIDRLVAWRRYLHQHPELSYQEHSTARFIAARLDEMGIPFVSGVGGQGIVATIRRGENVGAVALRADIDALPITEAGGLPHASLTPGVMHACGHDGHTIALLGAAEQLAQSHDWSGTVHCIFQPAEEKGGGAKAMLADGLLQRFPFQQIFGFHNWPGLGAGEIAVHTGPVFAVGGAFYITLRGTAGHAATPHLTRDPIVAAGHMLVALQTIVSRNVDPLQPAVVTIGKISGGTVSNQIPDSVEMAGTIRTYDRGLRQQIADDITRIAQGIGAAFGVSAEVNVTPGGQACINTPPEAELAVQAATAIGAQVHRDLPPTMGGDDMSYLLQERPGAYIWIGNGPPGSEGELHGTRYDFNDAILPTAVNWLTAVAKSALSDQTLRASSA